MLASNLHLISVMEGEKADMKILAFNGSPNKKGNTYLALKTVTDVLEAEGIQTEMIQIGGTSIRPCLGCRKCWELKNKKCIRNDDSLNDLILKMEASDGFIIGSPVYTSNITPEIKAFIDRSNFVAKANDYLFEDKIGAPVIVATKTGANVAYAAIQYMFGISKMISVGSSYWNCAYGKFPGDIFNDREGIQCLKDLGTNIARILHKINQEN